MSWANKIFLMFFFSQIIGSSFFLIWLAYLELWGKKISMRVNYWMLKLALVLAYIPINYLVLQILHRRSTEDYTLLPFVTPRISIFLEIITIVWIVGVFINGVRYVTNIYKINKLVKRSIPLDVHTNDILKKNCESLGIRKNVKIMRNYGVISPCVIGIIKPMIYVPVYDYTEQQLEVIINHELYHIKDRDFLWRQLAVLCAVFFWYNPLMLAISFYVDKWSEVACDERCLARFSVKDYYKNLLEVKCYGEIENSVFPMLKSNIDDLVWRFEIMKNINNGKIKKLASAISVISAVSLATFTSYAATDSMNSFYTDLYTNTLESTEIDYQENTADEGELDYEVHSCTIEELMSDSVVTEEIYDEEAIARIARYTTYPLNFSNISPNETKFTTAFTQYTHRKIIVDGYVSPSGHYANVGIVDQAGNALYIHVSGHFSYTFDVPSNDQYRIFVKNVSSSNINVLGEYQKK